ncbi:MAG: hypothetical protein KDE56_08620 [Anaerolineales bacterium]|nr:hypothetical protein [Anaerolineales bacterium]
MTQYALFKNIMIPMRDGVRLASDIYRPVDEYGELLPGPLAVILVRTSYNKEGPWLTDEVMDGFVPYGYVCAGAARFARAASVGRDGAIFPCGQPHGRSGWL